MQPSDNHSEYGSGSEETARQMGLNKFTVRNRTSSSRSASRIPGINWKRPFNVKRRNRDVLAIVRAAAQLLNDGACAVLAQWVQQQTDTPYQYSVLAITVQEYANGLIRAHAHKHIFVAQRSRRRVYVCVSWGQQLFYRTQVKGLGSRCPC